MGILIGTIMSRRWVLAVSLALLVAGDTTPNQARCDVVLEGYEEGALPCKGKAGQNGCKTDAGWKNTEVACRKYFGNPVACPDGIGPNGVFIYQPADTKVELMDDNHGTTGYCHAWDSPEARRGFMDCTKIPDADDAERDREICTKFQVQRAHQVTIGYAAFMMKRYNCKGNKCTVTKFGRCFNNGKSNFFPNSLSNQQLDNKYKDFTRAILKQMRDGNILNCTKAWATTRTEQLIKAF